jgi:hypothetical protein
MNEASGKKAVVSNLIGQLRTAGSNFPCRAAGDNAPFRDIFGDDGTSRDDGAFSDRHSGQDHRPRSDEDVVSQTDWPFSPSESRALRIMIRRQDANVG